MNHSAGILKTYWNLLSEIVFDLGLEYWLQATLKHTHKNLHPNSFRRLETVFLLQDIV